MNKKIVLIIIAVVAVIGWFLFFRSKEIVSTSPASVEQAANKDELAAVKPEDTITIEGEIIEETEGSYFYDGKLVYGFELRSAQNKNTLFVIVNDSPEKDFVTVGFIEEIDSRGNVKVKGFVLPQPSKPITSYGGGELKLREGTIFIKTISITQNGRSAEEWGKSGGF